MRQEQIKLTELQMAKRITYVAYGYRDGILYDATFKELLEYNRRQLKFPTVQLDPYINIINKMLHITTVPCTIVNNNNHLYECWKRQGRSWIFKGKHLKGQCKEK